MITYLNPAACYQSVLQTTPSPIQLNRVPVCPPLTVWTAAADDNDTITATMQQSSPLVTGLYDRDGLQQEIQAFVRSTAGAATAQEKVQLLM